MCAHLLRCLPWANHRCVPLFSRGLNSYCSPTRPASPESCPTDWEKETLRCQHHIECVMRCWCTNRWYLCCSMLRGRESWFEGARWVGVVCIGIDRGRTSLLHLPIEKNYNKIINPFIPIFVSLIPSKASFESNVWSWQLSERKCSQSGEETRPEWQQEFRRKEQRRSVWEQVTHCSRRVGERVLRGGADHRRNTTRRTSASTTSPRKLDTQGENG